MAARKLTRQDLPGTAAPLGETAAYLRAELVKWAQVVKDTGAKVD
jgi:hypothetical protein